jgi:DHA1 family multidrug resistance protein-like MFS transporter
MEIWKKNLYSIWIAQFFAMAGMSMVIPFLPFYIRELGITDSKQLEYWSGLVFAAPFISSFISTPIWGSMGDKFGKKPMVIRAMIGISLAQILIFFSQNVVQLFVFRIVQGAVSGFIAASLALVSSGTPKEKSGYAIGILQTSISAGTIVGPFLGGFLADIFTNYRNVFIVTAIFCFISGILVLMNVWEPEKENKGKAFNVIENIKFSLRSPRIKVALISICVAQIAITMPQPVFALFIESFIKGSKYISSITGAIVGILGVTMVIASPYWGKRNDAKGFKKNLLFAMTGASLALMLHPAVSNVFQLFPIRAFLGFCAGGIIPVFYSYIAKNTPSERKSGIMGIASSSTIFGNLLGPVLCTLLTLKFNIEIIFLISGLLIFVNTIFVWYILPETKIERDKKNYIIEE